MLACTTCIVAPHQSGELPCLTSKCTAKAMYSTSRSIVRTSTTRCRRRCTTTRSEEHTSELQSLMRISYAVFCLKKKKQQIDKRSTTHTVSEHNILKHV